MHELRVRPQYPKPYQVRWKVGTKTHARSFATKTLADNRRSQLMSAAHKGEPFDVETGLPKSELVAQQQQLTWFDHAKDYAKMKWDEAASAKGAPRVQTLSPPSRPLWSKIRRGHPRRQSCEGR